MIPLLALSACDTVPVMFSISKVNMPQYFQETFISAPGKDLIFFETESLETKNRWNKVIVKPSEKISLPLASEALELNILRALIRQWCGVILSLAPYPTPDNHLIKFVQAFFQIFYFLGLLTKLSTCLFLEWFGERWGNQNTSATFFTK